jgi:hypothetical protein
MGFLSLGRNWWVELIKAVVKATQRAREPLFES